MSARPTRELETALDVCKAAGQIQLKERASLYVEIKDDLSPVTQVDKACESLLVQRLNKAFPHDGFLGEETGETAGSSGRIWIIDPVDGTRPYIRDIPTYSVLLALMNGDGELELGVIHLPALSITCWATQGAGAFLNGNSIRVSTTSRFESTMGSALGFVEQQNTPEGQRLLRLMGQWDYAYGFMDAYSYVNVARGALDVCVNLLDKPWDCAAAACIVTEAGGKFTDCTGAPSIFGGSTVLTNGYLHDSVLASLT